MAVLLVATVAPQLLGVYPARADSGGYPWPDALCAWTGLQTGSCTNYDWGYKTCPSGDGYCTAGNQVNGYYQLDDWGYGFRNCTSYAAWKINQAFHVTNITGWGNAATWDGHDPNYPQPYPVYPGSTYTPQVGDIAQWENVAGGFGHVAYVWNVTTVNGVTTADLWDYNQAGTGLYSSTNTTAQGSEGTPDHYIHIGTASTSSTLRTIPTPDGHIQTFMISNGTLSENWYDPNPADLPRAGGWTQPVAMPSTPTGTPAVVTRLGNSSVIDVFVRGSNNHVYETWYDWNTQTNNWGGWIDAGGGPVGFTSDPQVVASADGNEQVFGTGGNYIEQIWFGPSSGFATWTTSPNLGQSAVGSPALAPRSGQYVIDEFVRGNNNQVYQTWYDYANGQWGGWFGMGGGPLTFESDPQVVQTSDGNDQVFGTSGNYVEQNWYNPSGQIGGWTTSPNLGQSAVGTPGVVAEPGTYRIDSFVYGSNNQVYDTSYNWSTGGWTSWVGMGGYVTSAPQTIATSDGHDQVFGTSNNQVQQNWFNPPDETYGGWISF